MIAKAFVQCHFYFTIVKNGELFYVLFPHTESFYGTHGYDNDYPDMWTLFLVHGPAFKEGYQSSQVDIHDIYPLMCKLLDLKPQKHDGHIENIEHFLKGQPDDENSPNQQANDDNDGKKSTLIPAELAKKIEDSKNVANEVEAVAEGLVDQDVKEESIEDKIVHKIDEVLNANITTKSKTTLQAAELNALNVTGGLIDALDDIIVSDLDAAKKEKAAVHKYLSVLYASKSLFILSRCSITICNTKMPYLQINDCP